MRIDELLPRFRGAVAGANGWTAFCPAHPDGAKHGNRSLSISQTDGKVLLHCFNECPTDSIVSALGLEVSDLFADKKPLRGVSAIKRPATKRQITLWWERATPLASSLAEAYLRSRGIDLPFEQLKSLRFISGVGYFEGTTKKPKAYYPCMVGAIADYDGETLGFHRTYLAPDGRGKANEGSPRKMTGLVKYGVRLSPRAPLIRIGEGVETILSVATAKGFDTAQYIAALSAQGLKGFEVPPWCETVEIYADNDPPAKELNGLPAAKALALTLKIAGKQVTVFCPPQGRDFNDLLREGGPAAVLAVQPLDTPDPTPVEIRAAARPVICTTNFGLDTITREAWAALKIYNEPPRIFHGAHGLVRVNGDIRALDVYGMRYDLARAARWERETMQGAVEDVVPMDVCRNLLADPEAPMPELRKVVSHWMMDPAGRILTEPGYDAESGCYLAMDEAFQPAEMTVDAAISVFDTLLQDFKWAAPSDRAHAFALMLLPFVRDYIHGETPIHVVEAPVAGTGKGLLVRVLLAPSMGDQPFLASTKNNDELIKRIESMMLAYREAVVIDNIDEGFSSETICSMVTASSLNIRRYHTQSDIKTPQRLIWAATVNNPQMGVDLARRSLRIRILAPVERPELRDDIHDDQLIRTAHRRRHELASAAYTMVSAWNEAGRDSFGVPPAVHKKAIRFGSFAHYARVIDGLLHVIGVDGFREEIEQDASVSPDEYVFHRFVTLWWAQAGDRWVRAKDMVDDAVSSEMYLCRSDKVEQRTWALSKKLNSYKDRIINDVTLQSRKVDGTLMFRLIKDQPISEELPF